MRTPYIWVYGFSHSRFTEYRLLAPFWLLPGRPWSAGYWQAALGRQNFSGHMCACAWRMRTFAYQSTRLNHTWPHQDKLPLCYGLSWQMDTSKVTLESVHWRKLKDTWSSSLIPTKVWIRGDRKHDILFWDRYQFNLICQICCIIVLQG